MPATWGPPPPNAKPVTEACGYCGERALHIETKLIAKPLGGHSLAGSQIKASARVGVFLVCRNPDCQAQTLGLVDDESRSVQFPVEAVRGGKRDK